MPHHGEEAGAAPVGGGVFQGRYIRYLYKTGWSPGNVVVNRVYVMPLEALTRTVTIDGLCYLSTNVHPGNYRIGLYGTGVPNPDLPDGAPLIRLSPAQVAGGEHNEWVIPIPYQLVPVDGPDVIGWIAVVFDDLSTLYWPVNSLHTGNQAVQSRSYDAGAFNILDPCPVTVVPTRVTDIMARVLSVP